MAGRLRIGEILVERGVLTLGQVSEILLAQSRERLPFGVLAERLFGVDSQTIQDAWLQQYQSQAAQVIESNGETATIPPEVQRTLRRIGTTAAERMAMAQCA